MPSSFGETKSLPNTFGSLGLPTTSNPPQQQPQTTQSTNIFGHLGLPLPQQSSTFGAQSKPPGSVVNPFLPQPSTQPPQTTTSGIGSGMFGASQPQQTSQPLGASILAQPQEQSQEQAGEGTTRGLQLVYFDNLLEKGKKNANWGDGGLGLGELPSLQLGLEDIARRARELGGVGTKSHGGATADSKASACGLFHLIS